MDVEFVYDTRNKRHSVDMTGEHALVAQFLNTELDVSRKDPAAISRLLHTLESQDTGLIRFVEWTLELKEDDVRICHNAHYLADESHPEFAPNSADWQVHVQCGRQDMIELLASWAEFVRDE
mgnify:FL=1